MSVTITAPQSRVVPRGITRLSWSSTYPQAAYEIQFKLATASSWSTAGRVTSTATSVDWDVSKFIDGAEYIFRVILYSVGSSGTPIYNGHDMSQSYSIIVTPKSKLAEMKVRYGSEMVVVPLWDQTTAAEAARISITDSVRATVPMVLGNDAGASKLDVRHPRGSRAMALPSADHFSASQPGETYIQRDVQNTHYSYYYTYKYQSYYMGYYLQSYSTKTASYNRGNYLHSYGTRYNTYYRGNYNAGTYTYYYWVSGTDYDYYRYTATGRYSYYAGTYGGGTKYYTYKCSYTYGYFEGSGTKYYCVKSGSKYECRENMWAGPFTKYYNCIGSSWTGGVMYYRYSTYSYTDYGSYRYSYSYKTSSSDTRYLPYYGYYIYYSPYYAPYYGYYYYKDPNYARYYGYYRYGYYEMKTTYSYTRTYWYNDQGIPGSTGGSGTSGIESGVAYTPTTEVNCYYDKTQQKYVCKK